MTLQAYRKLLTKRPFQPFRIVMSSGQACEVRHPEAATLTRTELLVGVGDTTEGVPAKFRICSIPHIASIEPLSPATTGSNM